MSSQICSVIQKRQTQTITADAIVALVFMIFFGFVLSFKTGFLTRLTDQLAHRFKMPPFPSACVSWSTIYYISSRDLNLGPLGFKASTPTH